MEKFDISPVAPAAAAAAAPPAGLILNVTYFSCLFMSNMSHSTISCNGFGLCAIGVVWFFIFGCH